MNIATALKEKLQRLISKSIVVENTRWKDVHSIKLLFQVDKQLNDHCEQEGNQLEVQCSGLGQAAGLGLLKPRMKSPPPKATPTTGIMKVL